MSDEFPDKKINSEIALVFESLTTREDLIAANVMRAQSWLDTYPNPEAGVSYEWVKARTERFNDPERVEARFQTLDDPRFAAWVAKDSQGSVIGVTSPFTDEDGVQHVGSLYVDKEWHGKGVGGQLMQKVIDFFDPSKPIQLEVAAYNQRAIAFYEKWGFEIVPGSEKLLDEVIPEVTMIRKGEKQ